MITLTLVKFPAPGDRLQQQPDHLRVGRHHGPLHVHRHRGRVRARAGRRPRLRPRPARHPQHAGEQRPVRDTRRDRPGSAENIYCHKKIFNHIALL